jgi:hypothetical protein
MSGGCATKGRFTMAFTRRSVDIETWDRVQQKLKSQTQIRRTSCPDDQSFLAERLPSFLQEMQAYRSNLRNQ